MCAKTLCPFVSSTRNIALGNASATVPSISIAPSLLAKDQYLLLCYRVNEHGRAPQKSCGFARDAKGDSIGAPLIKGNRLNLPHWTPPTRRELGQKIGDFDPKARKLCLATIKAGENKRFSIWADGVTMFEVRTA